MNKDEKNDFINHYSQYKQVLEQLKTKFKIPWQYLIKEDTQEITNIYNWFEPEIASRIIEKIEQRKAAERAGKILFDLMNRDNAIEFDHLVIEGRKKIQSLMK